MAERSGIDELEDWQRSRAGGSLYEQGEALEPAASPVEPGARRYEPGLVVGRGAMGVVRAARDRALGRDVALKELDPALATDRAAAARLAREACVTARLDHPGVVSVHDAGVLPDGRPFYTMHLIRGRTLAAALAEAGGPAARLALIRPLLAAAEAVAAAHAAGMVHRDLKPSNVLIGAHGETQVVDWGMAAPTPAAAAAWASLPPSDAERARVGTPAYVAPEQARGDPPDPRHDVWSLGATLSELLSGAPPSRARDLAEAAAAPPAPPEAPGAPPELLAVVARAMAPRPEDRYPDAGAFAADLLAWFEGRRVSAFDYSPAELLRRALRAWRLPLAVGAVGLLLVLAAVLGGWWSTERALERAVASEKEARQARSLAERQLARNLVDQAVAATLADARARAETLAVGALALGEDPLARGVLAAFGRASRPVLLSSEPGPDCLRAAWSPDGRWLACLGADRLSRWEAGRERWSTPVEAVGASVLPDAGVLAWRATGSATLLDAETGAPLAELPFPPHAWTPLIAPRHTLLGGVPWRPPAGGPAGCPALQLLALSPDAGRLAAFCGEGTLFLGTPERPDATRVSTGVRDAHSAASLRWTPDGHVLAGTLRGGLRLLDGRTGALIRSIDTALGSVGELAVSPDGALVVAGGTSGGLGLWSPRTGAWLGEIPVGRGRAFAFGPDGELVVHDGAVQRWRVEPAAPYRLQASAGLADLALAPDGSSVALAGGDGRLTVLRLTDGAPLAATSLGEGVIKAVSFEPGGGRLAAATMAPVGELALSLTDGEEMPFPSPRRVRRLVWLEGALIGTDLVDGLVRWDAPESAWERLSPGRLYVDLERESAASALGLSEAGEVLRVEARGPAPSPLATVKGARAVAGGGGRVAVGLDGEVLLLDAAGRETGRLALAGGGLIDVAVSRDGARVAASRLDGRVRVWDAATLALEAELPGHSERVVAVEFSPDGRLLLTASWDASARVWDLGALDRSPEELERELARSWSAVGEVD